MLSQSHPKLVGAYTDIDPWLTNQVAHKLLEICRFSQIGLGFLFGVTQPFPI